MKRFGLIVLLILSSLYVFAQTNGAAVGEPDATQIGDDVSQMRLVDITVSQFEDPGFWQARMASDLGLISLRRREGAPLGKATYDKERLDNEAKQNVPEGQYVLGVKVKFYRRAMTSFSIAPIRPLPIPGKCKTVSVWAIGRNFNHVIKIMLRDYFGQQHELTMDRLNFLGWKKLTVAIPPTIQQSEYHYTALMGIQFVGFKIYCDLMESYGTFYLYLDDLSAVTDLFEEEFQDEDDIADDW